MGYLGYPGSGERLTKRTSGQQLDVVDSPPIELSNNA